MHNKKLWSILTGVFAFLFAVLITGTFFASSYSSMINKELGISTSKIVDSEDTDEDTDYYKSSFLKADGSRDDDALTAWQEALCEQIQGEGSVLVMNDGALPVAKGASVTCFGRSSADIIYGGTGSGQVDTDNAATMSSALNAAGFKVNQDMLDWYSRAISQLSEDRSTAGMWTEFEDVGDSTRIAEIPVESVKNCGVSLDGYKDLAVVTIGRSGGEGSDLAVGEFADGENYFELQQDEMDLLEYVASLGFGAVVVLINSSNAMSLDWITDPAYGIDACLWIGGPGQYGMNAVAQILCGDINPSGRFVDTYSSSSLSAPAMQNFGGYTYENATVDGSAAVVGGVEIDGAPGDSTAGRYGIHYIVEEEGIYVGYKYYETRYEDCVLGQGNADGGAGIYMSSGSNWDYSDEVNYAFGYGLSYTTFRQTLQNVSYDSSTDSYDVEVKVENTGSAAGKDVVQVYAQVPYTDYDRTNGIEKSAVELVGFGKTRELKPGESETLHVEVERITFATYDSYVNKTYILEGSDEYFLAIGSDAHDALNNILAAKDRTTSNGMDYNGDRDKAYKFRIGSNGQIDATTYAYSQANTGTKITNQFDSADLNYYGNNMVTWLSRSDWQGTFPKSYDSLTANTQMIHDLQFNYEPDTTTASDVVTGSTDTQYSIVMMHGVDYDDETWEDLLNQLTLNEMAEIVGHSGYGTQQITSVSLPETVQADGPQGIKGTYAGGATVAYTSEPVMAATFNTEIMHDIGLSMGEDALRVDGVKISGWYGPAMNIHRTPYSGRCFEYFSEDGFLTGMMAANEVEAAQSMGLCCYIKHFALNDCETYRQSVATFATEQSIREIYLKGFQYSVEKGGATAVMTSFNRIGCRWAGAHEGLLTEVLRNEWGFHGVTLTDAVMTNRNWMDVSIGIEAGNDTWLSSGDWLVSMIEDWAQSDAKFMNNLRTSCHNFLYAYVNSTAINGLSSTSKVVSVTPGWQVALTVADWVCGVVAVVSFALLIVATCLSRKNKGKDGADAGKEERK